MKRAISTGFFAINITIAYIVSNMDVILKNPNAIKMPYDLNTMWIAAIFFSWLMFCSVLDITRPRKS